MARIAITGGIGSGKTHVCGLLRERGIEVYDCDGAAKRLMADSEEIRRGLIEAVGPGAYAGGRLNKAALSAFLLSGRENAERVNAVVHPAVARDFLSSGMEWMECAILFSSGFDRYVDTVVCVTAPEETRVARVMARDGLDRGMAMEWIRGQMPQEEVLRRSDIEIVNDGVADLGPQLDALLASVGQGRPKGTGDKEKTL